MVACLALFVLWCRGGGKEGCEERLLHVSMEVYAFIIQEYEQLNLFIPRDGVAPFRARDRKEWSLLSLVSLSLSFFVVVVADIKFFGYRHPVSPRKHEWE